MFVPNSGTNAVEHDIGLTYKDYVQVHTDVSRTVWEGGVACLALLWVAENKPKIP